MSEQLPKNNLRTVEAAQRYPGYPSHHLVLNEEDVTILDGISLPEGPWQMNDTDHPTEPESQAFVAAGYTIDAHGRPLHPKFSEMVTNENVGLVTGKGRYWNWGPNFTADPIVITSAAEPRVLLIKRGDTGVWALPGGFVDPEDVTAVDAARRELREEASLDLNNEVIEVYRGIVDDARTTAHAWPETAAYLFTVAHQTPVKGSDDAIEARWIRLADLDQSLFGSHAFLIERAIEHLPANSLTPIRAMLEKPKESLTIELIEAGHMAYDHLFIYDGTSALFAKEHVADRFDDPAREAHSRQYLAKEATLYEHLAQHGFEHIPERVAIRDDTLLAMDALKVSDGWQWRAPHDEAFDRYVTDILLALKQLKAVPSPINPSYHSHIEPSHTTFWKEGWDAIDDTSLSSITERMRSLSETWCTEQRLDVEKLIDQLSEIRTYSETISKTPELVMAHNDARQSNIAWHPEKGVRLVDWSWGDNAASGADSTMFLVDLAKSGFDVTDYLDEINRDQLIVLIGFWLAHSIWQTRDGSTVVREQQVASAVAAHKLWQQLAP